MKKMAFISSVFLLLVSCSKEKEKRLGYVTINNVNLVSYPYQNNGSDWDSFSSFPDPYFVFQKDGSGIEYTTSYFDEANQNEATWATDYVCYPEQTATFKFYDEDGATDDPMGTIIFDVDELESNGYPPVMDFTNNNGLRIKVIVAYTFK